MDQDAPVGAVSDEIEGVRQAGTTGTRRAALVAGGLFVGLFALGWWSWHPVPIGVWHDDGAYVLMAQSLADGDGLTWAGVAGAPPAAKFPPLFAVLAAGVLRWGPDANQAAVSLARLNIALMALAGSLFFLLVLTLGAPIALAAGLTAVLWTAPALWRLASVPLSEPLFMAASFTTLLVAVRAETSARAGTVAALLIAFAAAFHARTAGVALAAAAVFALSQRRTWGRASLVALGCVIVALPWLLWSRAATARIPEPLRDVLGSYGTWLSGEALRDPSSYLAFVARNAWSAWQQAVAMIVPLASGWLLDGASWLLLVVVAYGFFRLGMRALTPVAFVACYLLLIALWPFQAQRLITPVLPLVGLAVGWAVFGPGLHGEWPAGVRRAASVGVLALVAGFVGPNIASLAGGRHLADFDARARALAAAAEAVGSWVPRDGVVGAPELWAGLHIYTGRTVAPSARFLPLASEGPSWGTPEQQYRLWLAAGVDHVLAEHAGGVHGDALDRIDAECPGGAVELVAVMAGSVLARLNWDGACRERLGVQSSPLDLALLGGVDLLGVALAEQDLLHLRIQEFPGFRDPRVEAVVVDEQGLVDQPLFPTFLADVTQDPTSEVVLEGGLF